jgi:aspartate 1-decarboxylase
MVIIASYADYQAIELENFTPKLVYVDHKNRILSQRNAIPVQAA